MKKFLDMLSDNWAFYVFLGCIYIGMFYAVQGITLHIKNVERTKLKFEKSLEDESENIAKIQKNVVRIQKNVVKTQNRVVEIQNKVVRIQNDVLKELERINKELKEIQEKQ